MRGHSRRAGPEPRTGPPTSIFHVCRVRFLSPRSRVSSYAAEVLSRPAHRTSFLARWVPAVSGASGVRGQAWPAPWPRGRAFLTLRHQGWLLVPKWPWPWHGGLRSAAAPDLHQVGSEPTPGSASRAQFPHWLLFEPGAVACVLGVWPHPEPLLHAGLGPGATETTHRPCPCAGCGGAGDTGVSGNRWPCWRGRSTTLWGTVPRSSLGQWESHCCLGGGNQACKGR